MDEKDLELLRILEDNSRLTADGSQMVKNMVQVMRCG